MNKNVFKIITKVSSFILYALIFANIIGGFKMTLSAIVLALLAVNIILNYIFMYSKNSDIEDKKIAKKYIKDYVICIVVVVVFWIF